MSSWFHSKKDVEHPNAIYSAPQAHHLEPNKKAGGWTSKALHLSDDWGGKLNDYADKWGLEAFWPTSGDMPREMEKAARILKSFTIPEPDPDDRHGKSQYVRIPPSVIAQAKGLAIYSCMRGGCAPVGAGGGSGVVLARLPDGSWSAPAAILPTTMAAGMQIGLDVYSAVLVIRSDAALKQFGSHRFALGGEISVAAGPYGGGHGIEGGTRAADDKAAVYCYMHSRGAYFGLEVVGTAFVSRAEENGAMYHWPGIQASDILAGKVPVPPEASSLMQTLRAAETGVAQCPSVAAYGPGLGANAQHEAYDHKPSHGAYEGNGGRRAAHGDDGGMHHPKHARPGAYYDDGKNRDYYEYAGTGSSHASPSHSHNPVPPPRPASTPTTLQPGHAGYGYPGAARFVAPSPASSSGTQTNAASVPAPALATGDDLPPPPYSPIA